MDIFQVKNPFEEDKEEVGVDQPFGYPPTLKIIWHNQPIVEVYVVNEDDIIIAAVKSKDQAKSVVEEFEREYDLIQKEVEKVHVFLEPFVGSGEVIFEKNRYIVFKSEKYSQKIIYAMIYRPLEKKNLQTIQMNCYQKSKESFRFI